MRTIGSYIVIAYLAAGCGNSAGGNPDDDGGGLGPDGGAAIDARASSDAGAGYSEPVCADPLTSLADLSAAYANTAAGLRAANQGIADRRYPIGRLFIDNQTDTQLATWFQTRTTFNDVLGSFETAVHEGQHIWDFANSNASGEAFRVRDDLVIRTKRLTNFNRSEILTIHADPTHDFYADTYLKGTSGAQGFRTLLDEYSAYTHSLAASYCTRDTLGAGSSISARDGILTMMYYVELYLKLGRTQHPADYAAIIGDPEHVRLILTVWARAEFWLALSAPYHSLGIDDARIRTMTYDPANLAEIDMLR